MSSTDQNIKHSHKTIVVCSEYVWLVTRDKHMPVGNNRGVEAAREHDQCMSYRVGGSQSKDHFQL